MWLGSIAYYLAQRMHIVVGIIDKLGGLIKQEGFSFQEIKSLLLNRSSNFLETSDMLSFDEVNEKIWSIGGRNICSSCKL